MLARPFAKLQGDDEGQSPGSVGGPAAYGIEVDELVVHEDCAEPHAQEQAGSAVPKRGLSDASGILGHRWEPELRSDPRSMQVEAG